MKVIDLLNKIANGEEFPKKIKYGSRIYEYEDGFDFMSDNLEHPYFAENYCNDYADLNSEVEIIKEDKKIENVIDKIDIEYFTQIKKAEKNRYLATKINSIIDYISKESK